MRDSKFTIYGQIPKLFNIHYFDQTKGICTYYPAYGFIPLPLVNAYRCTMLRKSYRVACNELHDIKNPDLS